MTEQENVLSLLPSLLREIRDEIRGVRTELRETRDALSERIDATNARLDRVVQEQIRHATAIVELEKSQREILLRLEQHSEILNQHTAILNQHTAALSLLIRRVEEQGSRIDNVLLGIPGQTLFGAANQRWGPSQRSEKPGFPRCNGAPDEDPER
jgi:methyl-accepting chemotaxis protein